MVTPLSPNILSVTSFIVTSTHGKMHENTVSVTEEIWLYLIIRERGIILTFWLGASTVSSCTRNYEFFLQTKSDCLFDVATDSPLNGPS